MSARQLRRKKLNMAKSETAETEVQEVEIEKTEKSAIPEALSANPIFADLCNQYHTVFSEIAAYNKSVLTTREDGWTNAKIFEQAKHLGRPEVGEPNADIKAALVEYENAVEKMQLARKAMYEQTAKVLGITFNDNTERDPAVEGPLKEKRSKANVIGTQLNSIAGMLSDKKISDAVTQFLKDFPLPVVGRNQTTDLTETEKSIPRYRVLVTVKKGDEVLLEENGFTKAGQALTKPIFGYERGKAPKADDLRSAWEKAGNSPEATNANPVVFEDNGLEYTLTKRA